MHQFDAETALQKGSEGYWQGQLSGQWNIGANPNGGYMVALALQAISEALPHPHPLTVTTHFLRPGSADEPCEVQVDVQRSGRTMSNARATLVQQGKARIEVMAGFGDLNAGTGVENEVTMPMPQGLGPDDCLQRSGDSQGVNLPILNRLDTRLYPEQATGQGGLEPQIDGWIRFADGRAPDARALALFADAFPPSPFAMLGVIGWVPTLELTVQIRALPAPGWIRTRFHTDSLRDGRMIESGCLWDSTGQLVAQSRQLGLVMQAGDAAPSPSR